MDFFAKSTKLRNTTVRKSALNGKRGLKVIPNAPLNALMFEPVCHEIKDLETSEDFWRDTSELKISQIKLESP